MVGGLAFGFVAVAMEYGMVRAFNPARAFHMAVPSWQWALSTAAFQVQLMSLGMAVSWRAANSIAWDITRGRWGSLRTLRPILCALEACSEDSDSRFPLPRLLRDAERAIRRARLWHATVPRFSHRQRALKEHAGRVVNALRAAEARMDTYPELARCDLAAKLHTIAEQYAEGRLGALLPEEDLKDIEPVRDFESLRLAALAVAFPALTWATLAAGLAGSVQAGSVLTGMLVVALTLFGRRALETLQQVLGLFRGGA
ncbi:hypothetical protein [Streptomyces sp. NRRL WC-3742]|uniref:hypothetical protein n=1 Tax=Streptomyces sp. NRRL WC-3742 TaxID=1463934 RepID=UPI00068952D7|nr:hypothetical protein [Streptomyces sp. NRRL WC-3742]